MNIVSQLILNSVVAGAVYSLIALGFNLIYGTTKFFNLAHGVMAAIGGYSVFYLVKTLGLNLIFGVVAGVLFSGFVGYGLFKLVYRPLNKKKASNMVLLIASLGVFIVLQSIIVILFTSKFQTLSGNIGTQNIYKVFGATITQTQSIIVMLSIIVMIGVVLILKYTMLGKAIKAISDDKELAEIVGINTDKIIGYVFFIGSAIAGLVGILVGFDTVIEPTMGLGLLFKGVIASIIGGVGNVYGGAVGSFLLGFVENFGIWKISGEWKDAIAFGLLIVFLVFRPRGIMNK